MRFRLDISRMKFSYTFGLKVGSGTTSIVFVVWSIGSFSIRINPGSGLGSMGTGTLVLLLRNRYKVRARSPA